MCDSQLSQSVRLLGSAHPIATLSVGSHNSSTTSGDDHRIHPTSAWLLQERLEMEAPRRHGLIESRIERKGNHFTMSLQIDGNTHPFLMAEKLPRSGKVIFRSILLDTSSPGFLGSLAKTSVKGTSVTFSLLQEDSKSTRKKTQHPDDTEGSTSIVYEVPSVLQALKEASPRRAQVLVAGGNSVETKEPYSKGDKRYGLNFRGRGREASSKNMQLQDRDGNVVLQFVKWEKDIFHLDYASPFDAFHAFGFAMAQFSL